MRDVLLTTYQPLTHLVQRAELSLEPDHYSLAALGQEIEDIAAKLATVVSFQSKKQPVASLCENDKLEDDYKRALARSAAKLHKKSLLKVKSLMNPG